MDTNRLKKFAQETRIRLLKEVGDKLDYVLNQDTLELREYAKSISILKKDMERMGRVALIDKVAYTWFNRLMALRFMDANDYQPLHLMVVSPKEGFTQAEILDEAMQGHIPDELRVDRERINQLLDGKIISNNPQNEIYRKLLIASCNYLSSLFPFLFEKLNHYTELLLPDDLTSQLSLIKDFVDAMSREDCQEVEVMGWLYQFYISDRKDEVFAEKGKVEKEDIPAATQLFTPRWIVEYMVQNTVGKLWLQNNPHSSLREKMPYYIETEASKSDDYLKINSPEELTLLDQACGSGHILVYGFELLYHIYEEAGYQPTEIPELIIEKNLFGYEIDERAAQLASFTVLMKARSYHRRLFRNPIHLNILCYEDLRLEEDEIEQAFLLLKLKLSDTLKADLILMQQASNLGSLIQPKTTQKELEALEKLLAEKQNSSDIFEQQLFIELYIAVLQLLKLSKKFCCVVQNPPYMGGGKMNKLLSDFVRINYPDSKADLFSCFIELSINKTLKNGLIGNVTMESWMFLSSFEKFRENLLNDVTIDSLSHFGWHIMRIAFGTVSFILYNSNPEKNLKGVYNYLEIDDIDKISERPIQFPNRERRYAIKNQKDFEKIPGWNIGYWIKNTNFFNNQRLDKSFFSGGRNKTHNNIKYVRWFWEIKDMNNNWRNYSNGGDFRKWYGNEMYYVLWTKESMAYYDSHGGLINTEYINKEGITWNLITSAINGFRVKNTHSISSSASPTIYNEEFICDSYLLGFLNTRISRNLIKLLNPTLNTSVGDVLKLPLIRQNETSIKEIVTSNITISRQEWNSRETSWDFQQNELIRFRGQDIEEAVELYKLYWTKQFYQLHQNEEELNKEFIHIYGLAEELDPDVALEDITLLRDELDQRALKELSAEYRSGWELNSEGQWELPERAAYPELPFDEKELVMQLISYAVGCMFGRYSIDKEGLILANQGEGIADFFEKVGSKDSLRFMPDEDGVIPVLDAEWFEDDIVSQFKLLVKAVWGEQDWQRNIDYIERVLGKTLRNYFYRDFYNDHIKRFKKRPIYWMVSSANGEFQALIYLHRYTKDSISRVLNDYYRPYITKLKNHIEHQEHIAVEGSAAEQTKAKREIAKAEKSVAELLTFDREELYPLATTRVEIDLDDGVLVNYNKLGAAVQRVAGLNDAATKKKVRGFDWIDGSEIRN